MPKPYGFIGFGALHGPKPYEIIGFGTIGHDSDARLQDQDRNPLQNQIATTKAHVHVQAQATNRDNVK